MTIGRIPSVEGGIQPTIVDAKGDLIAGVAADSINRLAVGTNGTVLTADSSTSTGLAWIGVNQMANPVINGGFDIWQRGTTISSAANVYSADRWLIYRSGANLTTSRVATGDTTNLPNIQYAAQLQRTASSTNLDIVYFLNMFETTNTIPFVGKAVTLSFYARCGANYSPTSSALSASIKTGTGTDQNWISGYTGEATPVTGTATVTTTWQRFAFTGTIASSANELSVLFNYTPTGTAGANDWVQVTGVQIDVGTYTASTAPTFRRSGGTIQGELAACQRYYWRQGSGDPYGFIAGGFAISTTDARGTVQYPVPMRTSSVTTDFSNLMVWDGTTITAVTGVAAGYMTPRGAFIQFTVASGLTNFRPYVIMTNNNTAGYLGVSAEL